MLHPPPLIPYVIVFDDHPLVGRGMAQYLQAIYPALTVHLATCWADVQMLMDEYGDPQVLIADVWISDSSSLTTLTQWRAQCSSTMWLAISGDDDPGLQQRVRSSGAQGFVHKQSSPEVFGKAIAAVLAGKEWYEPRALAPEQRPREWAVTPAELGLTHRQGEVLELVLRGLPNKRIALMLGLSESTVKEHVTGILQKLGVTTRVQALTHLRGSRLALNPNL